MSVHAHNLGFLVSGEDGSRGRFKLGHDLVEYNKVLGIIRNKLRVITVVLVQLPEVGDGDAVQLVPQHSKDWFLLKCVQI